MSNVYWPALSVGTGNDFGDQNAGLLGALAHRIVEDRDGDGFSFAGGEMNDWRRGDDIFPDTDAMPLTS